MASLEQTKPNILFICGHPKSGTSLLRNLLDDHPELIVYPEETSFFRKFLNKAKGLSREELIELTENTILNIFEWNVDNPPEHQAGFPDRDYSDISYKKIKNQFRMNVKNIDSLSPKDYLENALISYGQITGQMNDKIKYLVEKTPYNELFFDQIFEFWPEAKCLLIVRDPRDNFVSYNKKHPEFTIKRFGENWTKSTSVFDKSFKKYGNKKIQLIKYEDLVNSFDETLNQILDFIDIKFHETLKSPTRAGKPWGGNSMYDQKFDSVSKSPVGRYKTEMNTDDLQVLEVLCIKYMDMFDYKKQGNWKIKNYLKGLYLKFYYQIYLAKQKLLNRREE